MKQAREIVRLSMECQSSPEDYCDVACRCDPLSVTRPLIARALDAAREEGREQILKVIEANKDPLTPAETARGLSIWNELSFSQGHRAGIEEAWNEIDAAAEKHVGHYFFQSFKGCLECERLDKDGSERLLRALTLEVRHYDEYTKRRKPGEKP